MQTRSVARTTKPRRHARRRQVGRRPARRGITPACPACAHPIRGQVSTCPHCGFNLDRRARNQMAEELRPVHRYQLGMKIMGVALIVLGALSVATGLILAFLLAALITPFDGGSFLMILAVIALFVLALGTPIWLGICALKFHNWVNWLVGIYYGLTLLGTSVLTINSGRLEASLGALIGVAMFALALTNIINRSRINKLGLDPQYGAVLRRRRRD